MNTNDAFRPGGKTLAISAPTSSPPAGVQLDGSNAGDISVWIYNPGANLVWLGFGSSATDATANAVAPVAGTPQYAIAIPSGFNRALTFSAKTYFSPLAVTSTQLIYLTSGQGM